MKYFKIEDEKYILGVYCGCSGITQITLEEYERISEAFKNVPELEEGMGCRLRKKDLIWVTFPIPCADEENEDVAESGTS